MPVKLLMGILKSQPGTLWAWGRSNVGQLGDGTIVSKSSPIQIGALTTWSKIYSSKPGSHSLAIKTDGTLWAWGYNAQGQLGDGTIVSKSSPIQVGALTTWAEISTGSNHSLAIKTDGTLWSWGDNDAYGQLGDGTIVRKSSPIQVGALTTWSKIQGGGNNSYAIKTDGTLWSWGYNGDGELGDGTIVNKSSPIQVGALTTWASISAAADGHVLSVKTDGTLWAWGYNFYGQLGDGTIISKSSPIQIGALTTWSNVACGNTFSVAVKTDDTFWAWGRNQLGQLGDGTIVSKSSPIQIGALTTWDNVSSGASSTITIKTDGTLWAWGDNTNGELGDGTIVRKSSPIQVGALTDWVNASMGQQTAFGLK